MQNASVMPEQTDTLFLIYKDACDTCIDYREKSVLLK